MYDLFCLNIKVLFGHEGDYISFFVGFLFGDEYLSTREFLFPLVLASMLKGFYKLHVNYIMFTKKTLNVTKITLSTGVLNLGLSYYLVSSFGIMGAAYALLLVNALQYISAFYIGNKLIPMPWFYFLNNWKK